MRYSGTTNQAEGAHDGHSGGEQDRRAFSPDSAILSRRGVRRGQRAGDRPLSGLDARAGARAHGSPRHRACPAVAGATGGRLFAQRKGRELRAPMQRLRRRTDRPAPGAVRLLRTFADARYRRGDRGSALLPGNAGLRRHLAVRKLRREISGRRGVRSAARLSRSRAMPWSTSTRACIRRASRSTCVGQAS